MDEKTLEDPLIEVRQLTKFYENGKTSIPVLRHVDLNIRQGEMVAVMGPSGSGKSTLLLILGLLLSPTGGTYQALGKDVLALDSHAQALFRRSFVGFVFQACNLIEGSTVYENLELPLIYAGVGKKQRRERILELLERANMSHRIHHPAKLLSGGEQQRAAVVRALMNNPRVILADEPTGQLDRENGRIVMEYFQKCAAQEGRAIVAVTHDPEVAAFCTRVCTLRDGTLLR